MVSESSKSEFNVALTYAGHLPFLVMKANMHSSELDIWGWFHSLAAIYRQLSTKLKDEEINKKNKEINEINTLVNKCIDDEMRTGRKMVSSDLYMKLHSFDVYLRRKGEETGLLFKESEDPSKALK